MLSNAPPERYPEVLIVFADAAFQGQLEREAPQKYAVGLKIVSKLLPERCVVERTIACLLRYRRLRADYETLITSSWA